MSVLSRVSKEAKVLIAITCLAGASLIWFNFFSQQRQSFPVSFGSTAPLGPSLTTPTIPSNTVPADSATSIGSTVPSAAENIANETIAPPSGEQVTNSDTTVAPLDTVAITSEESVVPVGVATESAAETVAIPDTPSNLVATTPIVATQALGDIQIAELPFLVTSPPLPELTSQESLSTTASGTGVAADAQRASINPFAPLVLTPVETPAASPELVDVPIPANPQPISNMADTPAIPVLQADAVLTEQAQVRSPERPSLSTQALFRPTPGGTLSSTPTLLRNITGPLALAPTSNATDANNVVETRNPLLQRAPQIQTPSGSASIIQTPSPTTSLITPSASTDSPDIISEAFASEIVPVPNANAQVSTPPPPIEATPDANAQDNAANIIPATAVGADELSRYLRDNNIRFTGTVNGPVSVGVFRSNLSARPVIVTLGGTYPDTDFVLTSLQGEQAQFKQGENTQTLAIDLRR